MQRHTIRGKTRTIIYPIIICLGITSIMGCKRLEINQTKRNWEKLSAYFTPPPLYQEKFGTYRNPLLFYNGDTVKNADDWLKRRKEIKDKWLSKTGDYKNHRTRRFQTTFSAFLLDSSGTDLRLFTGTK